MTDTISVTKQYKSASTVVFTILSYTIITVLAFLCLLPFIMLFSGSLSSEAAIRQNGYSIIPQQFSLEAYGLLFRNPKIILNAYKVSIFITAIGTFTGLMLTSLTAYVLSRKDFKYRSTFAFYFYFTTLFNGGLVGTYIFFIKYYNLKDNYLALILPLLVNPFFIFIMRSFVYSIPTSLIESAKIDGLGEWMIFFKIILPLLSSGLACIGLFLALGYWNNWYFAMLFIKSSNKYPLPYMLYDLLMRSEALAQISMQSGKAATDVPTNVLKLATAVVTTAPVLFFYPFVQKYFVRGITIGSVKG